MKLLSNLVKLITLNIVFLGGCMKKHPLEKVTKTISRTKKNTTIPACTQPVITVWIHGTRFFTHSFLKKFCYCPPGLTKAQDLSHSYHHHRLAAALHQAEPEQFPFNDFYLFGWSGKLSFEARTQAAHELYQALSAKVAEYQKIHGVRPHVRIITHSHGGNVALTMAKLPHANADELLVDQLIMLACPVQTATASCTQSPLFKKIYAFHSTLDITQVLDPQGAYRCVRATKHTLAEKQPFFSERIFKPHAKIRQAQIKLNGRGIGHVEFTLHHFVQLLPELIQEVDSWHNSDRLRLITVKTIK